jgi:rhodanese-related sulfurtransferase
MDEFTMKRFILQVIAIMGLSAVVGLAYNHFSKTPLPLFEPYDAHMVELVIANREMNVIDSKVLTENKNPGEEIPHFAEIDAETLRVLVADGSAILLDARPPHDYQTGCIPGGISLPISRFKETYDSVAPLLTEGKTIITYCEGIHCTDSSMLALALHKMGYTDILVYKGGIEEWTELGNEVKIPGESERDE